MGFKIRVKKDDKVVVLEKTEISNDVYRAMRKTGIDSLDDRIWYASKMADKIVTKAKCSPEDDFDERTGVNMVVERYKKRYCINSIKAIDRVINILKKQIEALEELRTKYC